jgi:succinate dehydrogenase hydrophobic anchor subunit
VSALTPPPLATGVGETRPGSVRPRGGRPRGLVVYLVLRLTGLALAVLVLGHFALTHVITDVAQTGSDFVGRRWASVVWVAWDWAMLGAALAHGGAGLWIVIDDYTRDAARRRRGHRVLVAGCAALWTLGSALIAVAIL